MSLFALSFDRDKMEGNARHYTYKFVPITVEQARGNYTVKQIPTGKVGDLIQMATPGTNIPTYFKILGDNQFRLATPKELEDFLKESTDV